MSTSLKIAGYARKSTDEPDRQLYTIEAQQNAVGEIVSKKQWILAKSGYHYVRDPVTQKLKGSVTVDGFYIDGGLSGTIFDRPALRTMRSDSKKGLFDMVLVVNFDRIARDNADSSFIRKELEAAGVKMAETSAPDLDSSSTTGKLIYGVKGVMAEFEHNIIGERVTRAMSYAIKKNPGIHLGRPRIGYSIGEDGELTLTPMGGEALAMLRDAPGLKIVALQSRFNLEYKVAWSLLRNLWELELAGFQVGPDGRLTPSQLGLAGYEMLRNNPALTIPDLQSKFGIPHSVAWALLKNLHSLRELEVGKVNQ